MRNSEVEILKKMLTRIGENHNELIDEPLCSFLPMVGKNYKGELMVVGRACNGGLAPEWKPCEMKDQRKVQEIADKTAKCMSEAEDGSCPMRWVTRDWYTPIEYNTKRSQFWRVIRNIVGRLNLADIDSPLWPSSIVWSNLYKISPKEGGNPYAKLANLQMDLCKELLLHEMELYQPKRLLILTGWGWAKHLVSGRWCDFDVSDRVKYIEATAFADFGGEQKSRIVVATHPQARGTVESLWVDNAMATFMDRNSAND